MSEAMAGPTEDVLPLLLHLVLDHLLRPLAVCLSREVEEDRHVVRRAGDARQQVLGDHRLQAPPTPTLRNGRNASRLISI